MWPFTKRKSLIIREQDATIFRLKKDIDDVITQLNNAREELKFKTQHIKQSQDRAVALTKQLENSNTALVTAERAVQMLSFENANLSKQITELTETVEVLKTELSDAQSRYDIDTHNLQIRIATLEAPLDTLVVEPAAEPKPQLVQVTDDFFGKLAAELATQWTKTTQHSGVGSNAKVSDRLTSMQQFAPTTTQSISNTASTRVAEAQSVSAAPKPVTEYIPSPDFLASFDEGTTQVDGQAVATGISITQPAAGPIKLPSQMAAEYEVPYDPDAKHYPL